MESVREVTDGNFAAEVLGQRIPTLVRFWTHWCGPCRLGAPVFDEVAAEYEGRAAFYKMDADQGRETVDRYSLRNLPTIVVFQDGEPGKRIVGFRPKSALVRQLDEILESSSSAPA